MADVQQAQFMVRNVLFMRFLLLLITTGYYTVLRGAKSIVTFYKNHTAVVGVLHIPIHAEADGCHAESEYGKFTRKFRAFNR